MSGLTPEIPFMASLWIRSGYDMKVEVSAETYQVGAHFKALIKAILVAPLKSFERFFRISSFPAGLCLGNHLFGCEFSVKFRLNFLFFLIPPVILTYPPPASILRPILRYPATPMATTTTCKQ